jgi:hypothetical protein
VPGEEVEEWSARDGCGSVGQVVAHALEVPVVQGTPRGSRQEGGATVVALDESDDDGDEGCEKENVHGRNSALELILPRVAGPPLFVEFLP